MISKEFIGLLFSITFFLCVAIFAFYVWFRDGANKCSRATLKEWDKNAPGSVTRFDEITQHPVVWKVGSILMVLVGLLAILLAISSLS